MVVYQYARSLYSYIIVVYRYINPQPKWSEFRETSFGHGELKIVNSLLMPSGVGIGMIMMSPYNY